MNLQSSKPNSSYILQIERKQIQHQNLKSTYLTKYLTKSQSNYIRIISTTRPTSSWQEIGEISWSNFHLLDVQCDEFVVSSFQNVQIFFLWSLMKLYAQITTWHDLNQAQFEASINVFKLLACTNLNWIPPNKRWILLNSTPWSWLCKGIQELCEEILVLKREKFEREMRFLIQILLFSWNVIKIWLKYFSLIMLKWRLSIG